MRIVEVRRPDITIDFGRGWYAGVRGTQCGWMFHLVDGAVKVSSVGVCLRQATIDEESLKIFGVGGVRTSSAFRGQGHATRLLRHVANEMDTHGFPVGALCCSDQLIAFYERLGWHLVLGHRSVMQANGKTVFPEHVHLMLLNSTGRNVHVGGLPW